MIMLAHIAQSFRDTFQGRASEWALALVLFNWSVILTVNETLFADSPSFAAFGQIISQDNLAMACGAVGAARLVVLGVNGWWRRSPHLRAVCSFLGAGFWFLITLGLIQAGTMGTGLAVYPVLLLLDSYNVIRAAGEAGIADLHHRQAAKDDHRI